MLNWSKYKLETIFRLGALFYFCLRFIDYNIFLNLVLLMIVIYSVIEWEQKANIISMEIPKNQRFSTYEMLGSH